MTLDQRLERAIADLPPREQSRIRRKYSALPTEGKRRVHYVEWEEREQKRSRKSPRKTFKKGERVYMMTSEGARGYGTPVPSEPYYGMVTTGNVVTRRDEWAGDYVPMIQVRWEDSDTKEWVKPDKLERA